jgi:hypothetical protein
MREGACNLATGAQWCENSYFKGWGHECVHMMGSLLSDCDSDHGIVACWEVLATWQWVHNDVKRAISKCEVMTVSTWLKQRSKPRCCQRVSYLLVTTTCDWNVSLYHKGSLLYLIQTSILHPLANYTINVNTVKLSWLFVMYQDHNTSCLLFELSSPLSSLCVHTVALLSIKWALWLTCVTRLRPCCLESSHGESIDGGFPEKYCAQG